MFPGWTMSELVVPSGLPVLGLLDFWRMMVAYLGAEREGGWRIPLGYVLLLALPCIVFKYLPMVDLPQHEAVVSMMLHLGDRRWAFDSYYQWEPTRTLYVLPYLLAALVSQLMPLHRAINCVVFCSVVAYPIGVLLYLRALSRPAWVALVTLPLLYNQSFFWGFVNFNLAVGLAFVTFAVMVGTWTKRKAWVVSLLGVGIALTHIYGLLLLGAYLCLWIFSSERDEAVRRLPALAPAAFALVVWTVLIANASGPSGIQWMPFGVRWVKFGESIAGGWHGHAESISLLLTVSVVLVFFRKSLPFARAGWNTLSVHQRIAWKLVALNLLLYFSMPELQVAALKATFRHAQLAAMAFPLALSIDFNGAGCQWGRLGLHVLGAFVIVNSWSNLRAFDAEARSFDVIVDHVPTGSRVAQLTYERRGKQTKVPAYLHFAAYLQAQKGGLLAVSFPARFWNVPIKPKAFPGFPPVPVDLEWRPRLFGKAQLSRYFDYLIVRAPNSPEQEPRWGSEPMYQLQLKSGPWWLFRKCEPVHE